MPNGNASFLCVSGLFGQHGGNFLPGSFSHVWPTRLNLPIISTAFSCGKRRGAS
jgi:hypothetical protein